MSREHDFCTLTSFKNTIRDEVLRFYALGRTNAMTRRQFLSSRLKTNCREAPTRTHNWIPVKKPAWRLRTPREPSRAPSSSSSINNSSSNNSNSNSNNSNISSSSILTVAWSLCYRSTHISRRRCRRPPDLPWTCRRWGCIIQWFRIHILTWLCPVAGGVLQCRCLL